MAREKGIRSYGPGKFNTILDSYVYELTLDGGADEELSYPEGGGWYGFIDLSGRDIERMRKIAEENKDSLTEDEETQITFAAAVILFERSDGIVEAFWFDNPVEADEEWEDIEKEFAESEGEEGDEDDEDDEDGEGDGR